MVELDWCLRMILAAICGGFIGFERKTKAKNVGIRTHALIALGAVMAMFVSKYGFFDLLKITHENWAVDPSRIAAQVISGIGFLGAGTSLSRHNQVINGLTTATGIWVTGAIGLAYGSGLYSIGVIGTAFVLLAEFLGKYLDKFAVNQEKQVSWFIQLAGDPAELHAIIKHLRKYFKGELGYSLYGYSDHEIAFRIFGSLKPGITVDDVFTDLISQKKIKRAELE